MDEKEKEESKKDKIRQILKAGTKSAAETLLKEAGAEVETREDDKNEFLLLKVAIENPRENSINKNKIEETFTLPYGTQAEKIEGLSKSISEFIKKTKDSKQKKEFPSQEEFDEVTKKSAMLEFWTLGKEEIFRALFKKEKSKKLNEKLDKKINEKIIRLKKNEAESFPNWDFYRYIGEEAFLGTEMPDKIRLPKSLVGIGRGAFKGCSIKEIWIPDTTQTIGEDAFRDCGELKKISLPGKVKIGESAFKNCRIREAESENFYVKKGVAYSGNKALYITDRKSRKITIESGIEKIVERAFMDGEIKKVILPNGLREIGRDAFKNCGRLQKIDFPERMTSIGANAFSNCQSLKKVKLPSGLLVLGVGAFRGCKKLCHVEAEEGPELVAREAFMDCPELKSIKLDKAEEIDERAFDKKTETGRNP